MAGPFSAQIQEALNDFVRGHAPVHQGALILTDAQVKHLPNSGGMQIVAAPGSGKLLLPQFGWARLVWVANYTGIDPNANLAIGSSYLGDLNENPEGQLSALLANSGSSFALFPELHDTNASGLSVAISGYDNTSLNQGIYLEMGNGGLDLTGGNVGNSLIIAVTYLVLNASTGVFE